jgi:membrane-associated protein
MFESLENAVQDAGAWAYLIIFAIALLDAFFPVVPSETLVILGGVLASGDDPTLTLPLVILSGGLGALCGDNVSYSIGRFFAGRIERWAAKTEKRRARREWAGRQIRERGMLLIITARFIPGGRTIVTLTCGATHQKWPRFFFATVVAAAIWATYAAMLGYVGGEALKDNHTLAFVIAFATALSVSGIIELVRHKLKRRRERAEALAD